MVAHRGASEDAPEHTLAAYRKALADGADALECDVRLTADGHLVCVHDRRVDRTSDGRGAVSTLELADLAALDFGSWKDPRESPETVEPERTSVLTLERLLQLVVDAGRPVELAIETKHPTRWAGRVESRLLEVLRRFDMLGPDSPVRVMSFSLRSLQRVREAAPHLATVWLMQFVLPGYRDGRLPRGVPIAGPSLRLVRSRPEYVARWRAAGYQVHVWTVDEPADVDLCAELDVDAVITNRPRQVRERLAALGRR